MEISFPASSLVWDILTLMSALTDHSLLKTSEGEDYALMKSTSISANGTDKSCHIWKLDAGF